MSEQPSSLPPAFSRHRRGRKNKISHSARDTTYTQETVEDSNSNLDGRDASVPVDAQLTSTNVVATATDDCDNRLSLDVLCDSVPAKGSERSVASINPCLHPSHSRHGKADCTVNAPQSRVYQLAIRLKGESNRRKGSNATYDTRETRGTVLVHASPAHAVESTMYSARSGGPASVAAPSFTFHHDHSVISSFGPGDLSEDCKRLLKIRARKGGRSCMVDSITSGFIQPSTGDFITEFPLDDNSRRTLVINQKGRCKNLDNDIKRWQREMQTARKDPSVVERREKIMRGGSFPADEATCLSGSSQQAGTEASGTVTNEAADSSEADLQNAHATESCQPPMTMPVAY